MDNYERFRCSKCLKEYETQQAAEICEGKHQEPLSYNLTYEPPTDNAEDINYKKAYRYAKTITVQYEDGQIKRYNVVR